MAFGEITAALHRVGVTVDANDPTARRREQCFAVSAAAESAVDVNGIIARRQCIDYCTEKNWNMPGRL
jgi:hypothetical protein